MRTLALLVSVLVLLVVGTTTPVLAERRVALVIGNADYKPGAQLATPRSDAEAVAAALRDVGFQTVKLELDLNRTGFIQALRAFATDAHNADWAVVYFAGYGIEADGLNYLIPIDANLDRQQDLRIEAVPLEYVLEAIEGSRKVRLVLLDASRDSRKMIRSCWRCPRGLARVEPESGTLVGFSTKDGLLALEGDGKNSPYVTALLNHIKTPGLDLLYLFRNVRDDVLAATAGRQEPFLYGAVSKELLFFVGAK